MSAAEFTTVELTAQLDELRAEIADFRDRLTYLETRMLAAVFRIERLVGDHVNATGVQH